MTEPIFIPPDPQLGRPFFDMWLSRSFGWYFAAGRRSVVFWRNRNARLAIDHPHPGQIRICLGHQRITFSGRRLVAHLKVKP